jgi:prophage regulatory protein
MVYPAFFCKNILSSKLPLFFPCYKILPKVCFNQRHIIGGFIMQHQNYLKFLREPQVYALTGLSKSTRWRLEKEGRFPKKRQLSAKSVGWLAQEIEEWIQTRNIIKTKDTSNDVR